MSSDHEHDRFLYKKDGFLHFGCINPFCGHGDPALPQHFEIPLNSKDVTMKLLTHKDRRLRIEVTPKEAGWKPAILECEDNLEACNEGFRKLIFNPQ